MGAAYFKNIAETRTLIQLLQERSLIQQLAGQEMRQKFDPYNLEREDVLIGTPGSAADDTAIETILTQLRQRQIAEEQVETYARQEKAAVQERQLREAEARAQQQRQITESELSITVQTNQGKADLQRSLQQASQIRALADAEAQKIARLGVAQAIATEEQVRAYGGPQFQVTQQVLSRFADAIQQSGVDVVPRVVVGGGSGEGGVGSSSLIESLLALLLSEKLGVSLNAEASAPRSPEVEALRRQIYEEMRQAQSSQQKKS